MLRHWKAAPKSRTGRHGTVAAAGRPALLAVAATMAAVGAVSAESLAQPSVGALEKRAADYIRFREDIATLEATPFNSAETTREAHRRLSAHDSKALSGGWVAYAALVAADTPAFAEALKGEVASGKKFDGLKGKDAFIARLSKDPGYPRRLGGADEATRRVLSMTAADIARVNALGEAFKTQAYAMQKTAWGKKRISAPPERLRDADAYASGRPVATAPELPALTEKGVTAPMLASVEGPWGADWGKEAPAALSGAPDAQVIMDRVLNLAARYAVGGVNAQTVETWAKNDRSERCLSMNVLMIRQCIAATRTPYEEAFCLGEHGLIDQANCLGWVAGAGGS